MLRPLCVASWHAARSAADDGGVLPLNAAAGAGLYLEAMGDAGLAIGVVRGEDDWSARVRGYLKEVQDEERGGPVKVQ